MQVSSSTSFAVALNGLLLVHILTAVSGNWLTNLFSHSQAAEAHERVNAEGATPHQHSWTHELIAAAAGYEAMKGYENYVAREGGVAPSHSTMKDLLAGFAAAAADRLIETKGLDWLDAEKAKNRAIANAHHIASEKYGPTGTSENSNNNEERK